MNKLCCESGTFDDLKNEITKLRTENTILKSVIESIPSIVYWKDLKGCYLGHNSFAINFLKKAKIIDQDSVVGLTDKEIFNFETAIKYDATDKIIFTTGKDVTFEEVLKTSSGNNIIQLSYKRPLHDDQGNIIGVIGISNDVTVLKDAEKLKLENAKYRAENQVYKKSIDAMSRIANIIDSCKVNILENRLGKTKKDYHDSQIPAIKFSKREEQVLYLLCMGKNPKEIANILTKLEDKSIATKTIYSVINKQLYSKLDVNSYSMLVEKAIKLNLLKFVPNSLSKLFTENSRTI